MGGESREFAFGGTGDRVSGLNGETNVAITEDLRANGQSRIDAGAIGIVRLIARERKHRTLTIENLHLLTS